MCGEIAMSQKKRMKRSAEFKFKVAMEAAKNQQTINQIASYYQVTPAQVSQWKQALLKNGKVVFESKRGRQEEMQAQREVELYEQIGRLKMELEWLKKKAA